MPEHAGPPDLVAIVAGRGDLARRVAERRAGAGLPVLLVIFEGSFEPWMETYPHEHHAFERAGQLFRALRAAGARYIVFAGAMTRPKLQFSRLDWGGVKLLTRALRLMRKGDDAMLRGFGEVFEQEGIALISPRDILGDSLSIPAGPLGMCRPSAVDIADAQRAAAIVRALAPLDVGQGAVVAGGLCLGVEAIGGTDFLLSQIASLPADRRKSAPPPCGVLYKGPKPGQDLRVDLPAIGPETVAGAARAGLSGIVVAARQTLLLDETRTRSAADDAGLFVYGAQPEELT